MREKETIKWRKDEYWNWQTVWYLLTPTHIHSLLCGLPIPTAVRNNIWILRSPSRFVCISYAVVERRVLQAEYDQLRLSLGEQTETARCHEDSTAAAAGAQPATNGDVVELQAADVRQLRQHKSRLETRMRVLEEHNEQLDSQLRRLRQLLHDSQQVSCTVLYVVTLLAFRA